MKCLDSYRIKLALAGCVIALFVLNPVAIQAQDGRPIADAGSSRYAGPDPIVLDGTHSYDPYGSDTLSYTWRQTSGPSVVIIDANTPTPTIAGSIQPDPGRDPTPKPQGFPQTDEIQECEFELVVSDGELTSLPDIVKVIIVPTFTDSTMVIENEAFDAHKPTIVFFDGAYSASDLSKGGYFWNNTLWEEKANVISFVPYVVDPGSIPGYNTGMTFSRCADMIIVYLSANAPDYNQRIQTLGMSLGGVPAIDVALRLNRVYADARYAVNHVSFLDATDVLGAPVYRARVADFLVNPVEGEQCWVESYNSSSGPYYINALNVQFETRAHSLAKDWYRLSLQNEDMNVFNNGVIAGSYWSVVGPGKNLQLASTGAQTYKFLWYGSESSGHMDFLKESSYPGRLPEPVTLVGPVYAEDSNGIILTCEESENSVGYQLLFGHDPYRVIDYRIISDTPAPPNDVITAIPSDRTWWTVRVRDQYGSTIYADPISMVAYNPNPADGAMLIDTWATLSWAEGMMAASYDVYLGESFIDVQDGTTETFQGNQTSTYFIVGFPGFPYPNGLVPGTTYYWRIDDVGSDGTVIHKGKIWRFTVSP